MLSSRRSSASRLPMLVFWLVAIATQINLNHFFNMVVGSGWFISLGLAICSIYLFLAVRIPFRLALGGHGYLIVASMISYLIIGLSVTFLTGTTWHMLEGGGGYRLPFRVCLSVMVIVASGFGAWVVLQKIGVERLLAGVLFIQAIACILILMTPWLIDYVYYSLSDGYQHLGGYRFMGSFKGSSAAGVMACYTVASALALSLSADRYRMLAWGVAILGSVAAFVTFSRSAVVMLALLYLFFLWSVVSTHRLRPTSVGIWLLVTCVVGIFVLVVVNAEYLPLNSSQVRRLQWFVTLEPLGSMSQRAVVWPLSISYIAESPIFGHGLSQFHQLENGPTCYTREAALPVTCGSHNAYLMLWGEAGIIPAALYLFFVGSLFWIRLVVLPKSIITDTVVGWGIVLAMAGMTVDEVPYAVWNNFIMGLICAMLARAFRESRKHGARHALEPRSMQATGFPGS